MEPIHVHHWRLEIQISSERAIEQVAVEARSFLAAWVRRHRGRCLNDLPPFDNVNPTAEEVAHALHAHFTASLPDCQVGEVCVGEAAGFSASYRVPGPYSA